MTPARKLQRIELLVSVASVILTIELVAMFDLRRELAELERSSTPSPTTDG